MTRNLFWAKTRVLICVPLFSQYTLYFMNRLLQFLRWMINNLFHILHGRCMKQSASEYLWKKSTCDSGGIHDISMSKIIHLRNTYMNFTKYKNVPSQFTLWFITWFLYKKVVSSYGASPYCLFPGCIVTWVWSLAKGQYMVSWLLTGAPEQRYWQNRETANIGLVSSVGERRHVNLEVAGSSPALVNFSLFIQNLS